MTTIVGRNCKVEVALTFDAALAVTAVTKAAPPVATFTAHGLTDWESGYWSVSAGMIELDEQATAIEELTANTFSLLGMDATNFTTYTAGNFYAAATWGTLAEAGSYNVGGGEATALDDPRLMDNKMRQIAGFNAPENISFDISAQEIDGTALKFVIQKARNGEKILVKISKGGQILRVAYGTPSVPGENVQAGQRGTGSFSLIVPASVVKPNVATV